MAILLFLALSGVFDHSLQLVFGGDFRSAVMDKENIYVTDGRGVSIFALSDMHRIGNYYLPGYSHDLGMWKDNLYVAGSRGLAVLEMDPADKKSAGISWIKEGGISALSVSGDTLWFSDTSGNLYGQNLASGSAIAGTPVALPAVPVRIVPSKDKIYLAADTAGFWVVDLETKSPEVKRLALDGAPAVLDVLEQDNLLYIAAGDDGLWVVEPRRGSVRVLSRVATEGQVNRLAIFKDRLAAASGTSDLSIFSLADPKKPVLAQEEGMSGLGTGLALEDSLALLLTGVGFGKVDLSIKPNALQGIFFKRAGVGYDILARGNIAVLAIGEGGIRTLETGDPLSFLGTFPGVNETRRLYLFGSQVYTITATNLLQAVDIKEPAHPEKRAFLQFEYMLRGLDAEGEMVLTAEDTKGVGSFWRCPCGPLKEQGRMSVGGRALDIRICPQTKLAFVSVSPGALETVSWKDSTHLETVATTPLSRDYEKLYLDGDLLFGLDESGALTIINVSRPTRPKELAVLELQGTPSALARDGDTLFIASGEEGVYAVDISKPSSPQIVQNIDIDKARGVAVSEGRLLVVTPYAVEAYNLK